MSAPARLARSSSPRSSGLPRDGVIGVVGLGLMGGSIVRCLRGSRPRPATMIHDRRRSLAAPARRYGHWCSSLTELVVGSDIIILAVPVPAIAALLGRVGRLASLRQRDRRLIVCDVGSIKAPLVEAAKPWAPAFDYIGLHPIAGREHNGWGASDADLFRGQTIAYCRGAARLERTARDLISLLGGRAHRVDARLHDRIFAETIGLPHLLAFAAAAVFTPGPESRALRGGSWGSLTRVSVSDPAMVAGFLDANAANQRRVLDRYRTELDRLAGLLGQPTAGPLKRALRHASGVLSGRLRRRV